MTSILKGVRPFSARLLRYCLITILAVTLCEAIAHGQAAQTTTSVTDGQTPAGMQPGSPAGSYPLSGIDNVNLFNGNLNFHLPLLQVGGRGSAQMTINLALNLKSWHISHNHKELPDGNTIDSFKPTQLGWRPYGGYGAGQLGGRNYGLQTSKNLTCTWYSTTVSRLTFSSSDGTEYELRDQLTNGQPLTSSCSAGASRGTVFVSTDGSAVTFVSDTTIFDNPAINVFGPHGFSVSGFLMFRDGTRYRIDNGDVTWIRDRNGNKITFTYSSSSMTITDQLNRTITINYDVSDIAPYGLCDQIIYKGFGGAQRILRVSHTNLGSALRPNSGYSIRTIGGTNGLFPETDGSSSTTYDPTVTSAVWLPDGARSYKFYYNSYGELARVELPTGGAYEYDMTSGSGVLCAGVCSPGDDRQIYRRVVERRIYADGSSGTSFEHKEIYTNTESVGTDSSTVTVEQVGPTGTVLGRSRHYFDGGALNSLFGSSPYTAWYVGTEKQTDSLDTAGSLASATVLARTVTTRQQRASISWWSSFAGIYGLGNEAANDPRVTEVVSTIEPATSNLVSKRTFGYDDSVPFNNQNSIKEYGFGNGTSGGLQRETRITFVTSSTYTDPSVHIRDLATQVSVYDGAGAEKGRSTIEYDNYVTDSYHSGLAPRSNLSGFDSAFTTSLTTRGNPTASTSSVFVAGSITGTITGYTQYDVAGNVVKTIDPRSTPSNIIATTIEYDDRYGSPDTEARSNSVPSELTGLSSFAFPTKVINALGHTSFTQIDFYLGKPINSEDANGVVSSAYFNEPLDRPTQTRRAAGTTDETQTTFAYDDANRIVTTSSDRDTNGDNFLVSKVLFDQMGRTIQNRRYEGGSNYIVVETKYDSLGRPSQTSNPYRPWQSETAVWTTQAFDALGRLTSTTTPDSAVVARSYSGNTVTVTDQAGKARKSISDALGRLIEVDEDPTGLNYQTTYLFDVLDNLVRVTQASQQRFFMYDSLKRVIRVRHPEQSTSASLNLSDPITGNSAWSVAYQYDSSNNLTQKTDARGVVSTYAYDALNRNTTIDYSDTASINPDVKRFYDGATKGIGRFWYFYKGGDLTTGNNVEQTAVDSYDRFGRPLVQRQLFKLNSVWGPTYQTSRTYNLAGAVTSQIYPSLHTISYSYDAAGRAGSFSGNLGDGVSRTYAGSITYSPFGGPTTEQFGTDTALYHKSFYNIRGQLFDTRLSSVNDMWDWNRGRLILYYSSNHLWGQSGSDNNGNLRFAETWIPPANATLDQADTLTEDSYVYDGLNRLSSVLEQRTSVAGGWGTWTQQFRQQYTYDRYGNRTIDAVQTWGTGVNNKQFTVDTATNRLGVPAGQSGVMTYDNAGNLITDSYNGAGLRTYDANNQMLTAADNTGQISQYTYDADGRRVRRQVGSGQEQWQIYGIEGELIAEYPANGSTASPQKEYGYRNGQLLVTAQGGAPASGLVGYWKLDENTGTATADSAGSGNAGTLTSGAAWGTGQSGSAVNLDGVDDYVQVGAPSSLVMTTAVSMSAWIYPTGAGSNGTYGGTILVKEGEYVLARFPNGKIQWGFANSNPGWLFVDTGYTAPLNQWTHIAVTYDNGTIKTYANGTLAHTYSGSGTIGDAITGQNDFRIGGRQAISQNFQGRIDEVRVYNRALTATEVSSLLSGPSSAINWLVTDQLGTPRMIVDQSGALANLKRHDYLPFGEELFAPAGGRTTAQGYTSTDGVRQQFTLQERDNETGLDFFQARYYSSGAGRFSSVDPFNIALDVQQEAETDPKKATTKLGIYLSLPQQWNRYSYAMNNPLVYVDPTGEAIMLSSNPAERARQMQALMEIVGPAAAGYLYENQGSDGNWYVGIYDTNPTNGDTRSFTQVNDVAGFLAQLILDPKIAKLEMVGPGTVTDDSGDQTYIGTLPGGTPGATGYFRGVLTIKILDWGRRRWSGLGSYFTMGYLPGTVMSDGKSNMLTPSLVIAHELAHAWFVMCGDGKHSDSNRYAVDFENRVRFLQTPNGPTRKFHNPPSQ